MRAEWGVGKVVEERVEVVVPEARVQAWHVAAGTGTR
jgi:hypothetical protein